MESHTLIPYFIEGKDKKELVRNMLNNNIRKGGFVKYFDIQKDGTKWVAWYHEDLANMMKNPAPEEKKPSLKKTRNKKNV